MRGASPSPPAAPIRLTYLCSAVLVAACSLAPGTATSRPGGGAAGPCPPKPEPQVPAASDLGQIPRDVTSSGGASVGPKLLTTLIERLERVEAGLQYMAGAPDAGAARREARVVLDQLVGPGGRHTSPTAAGPGLLPAAQPALTDPGIALTIFGTSQDARVSNAISGVILGDVERWQQPTDRWTEIDAAVAAWTPTNNSMQSLDGRVMRLIGWSLLALQTQDTGCAHEFGANGAVDAAVALQAAREALLIGCTWTDVECV